MGGNNNDNSNFDLQGFLNSPQAQANKPAAVQYLQSKGVIDSSGQPIAGQYKQPSTGSKIVNFLKGVASPIATILARPIQAVAELAGASSQEVDAVSNKLSGGLIAPVPQNSADVEKDVGRAVQTVALGAGPESLTLGGAAFGAGNSLTQGNKLFSVQTALQTALGAAGGKVLGLIGKPLFNVAGKVIGQITPDFLADLASKGNQAIVDFAAQHQIVPSFVRDAASAVGDKISAIGQTAKDAITSEFKGSAADQVVQNLKNKALGTFAGKTQAEILATPETDVYKLSPTERKFYYDTQTSAISDKAAQAEAQVKTDISAKASASQAEAEGLQRQVAVASRDETVALRPKVRSALASQSQEYRRLVQEEIQPHVDTPVTAKEVSDFIDTRFSDDPLKAASIKNKMGITADTNPNSETTIGKLYDKTKSLSEDIASGAKKGNRTYTPDEKLTDDAINTITDLMKNKGVDLTGARQFWARYAPIRNQLVAEVKPFISSGTQTKTFANTLTRVAQGTDVNNENFIAETENLLGQKVGQATKDALSKLTANAKQLVADQVQAEAQKAEIALEKEKALQNWSVKQFNIERQAVQRKILINAFKVGGAVAGYAELRHVLPFLPAI